ncbi:MAG: DUF1460 domain-containing protein [Elusimicrobia bacterium]|nr:DUF1460 domain-containing protein [Elusimicrobiota bacterium]
MSEAEIALELKTVHAAHPALADRIDAVSERFLGVPYKLGPMGEGDGGDFERKPLYSFRELDCTTFVAAQPFPRDGLDPQQRRGRLHRGHNGARRRRQRALGQKGHQQAGVVRAKVLGGPRGVP